ncbi:hypothetical protein D3C78_1813370 [compost metagenome]
MCEAFPFGVADAGQQCFKRAVRQPGKLPGEVESGCGQDGAATLLQAAEQRPAMLLQVLCELVAQCARPVLGRRVTEQL